MSREFRWLALVGVVVTAALVGPSAALACDHSGSAVSIYTSCQPSATGASHPTKSSAPPVQPTVTTPIQPTQAPPQHSSHNPRRAVTYAVKQAGKDMQALRNLVTHPWSADARFLNTVLADAPAKARPGSTFDLGVGPTIFFALLLGTLLVLLGTGGVRSWRNRHRV